MQAEILELEGDGLRMAVGKSTIWLRFNTVAWEWPWSISICRPDVGEMFFRIRDGYKELLIELLEAVARDDLDVLWLLKAASLIENDKTKFWFVEQILHGAKKEAILEELRISLKASARGRMRNHPSWAYHELAELRREILGLPEELRAGLADVVAFIDKALEQQVH